jgi:lipopolysaccharide transport system permease protein
MWVIEPVREGVVARTRVFWLYRRILWFLASQQIKSTYQGMTLGPVWLVARPFLPVLINSLVFGGLLKVGSDGLPYFMFFCAGHGCWYVFERSLMMTTRSIDRNRGIIKKVYFPRVIAPISAVSTAVVYFAAFMALLLLGGFYYLWKDGVWYLRFGPELLLAPLTTAASLVLAIGIGMVTSLWQLRFKEMRYTIRYFAHFWSYVTPVIWSLSALPPQHRWVVYANPMAPIVATYRWALFGKGDLELLPLLSSAVSISAVLAIGLWYFNRAEGAAIDKM